MKITQEGPTELLLRDHNISGFVGGIIFALIGLGTIYLVLGADDAPIWVVGLGALFAIVGIYLFLRTKIVTIRLNKAGQSSFSTWSILSRKKRDIPTSSIKGLRLDKFLDRSSKKTYHQYSLVFLLDTKEELAFEFGRISASILDFVSQGPHEKKRSEARRVSEFLGVPLEERGPPSAAETISALKETIAGHMQKRDEL